MLAFCKEISAAFDGGCSGFYLKNIKKTKIGTVIIIASSLKNFTMSSGVDDGDKNIPASDAPIPLAIRLVTTLAAIIFGTDSLSYHLIAKTLVLLKAKTFPALQRIEPKVTQAGLPICMRVLAQTPSKTRVLPSEIPTFIPNLSRMRLAGVAIIG